MFTSYEDYEINTHVSWAPRASILNSSRGMHLRVDQIHNAARLVAIVSALLEASRKADGYAYAIIAPVVNKIVQGHSLQCKAQVVKG